jgi:hypothetical protein
VPAIRQLIDEGAIGEISGIDGALTNPLAHAVATGLALNGSTRAEDVTDIRTELLRANDIESDDTSCVRVATAQGRPVTVAATLCAEHPGEPYVLVHGSRGRITFWYKQDRVLLQRSGHGPEEYEYGCTDLLENLVDHFTDGTDLLVPPDVTGAFMKVVEAIRTAPDPAPLPDRAWRLVDDRRVVPGVDGLVAASADTLALFSELGASWAPPKEVST